MVLTDYIRKVLRNISDKELREEIASELSCHIEEKTQDYMKRGYSPEDAEKKAVEDMGGEPERVGMLLSEIHPYASKLNIVRNVLSCIVFAATVLIELLYCFVFLLGPNEKNGMLFAGLCFILIISLLLYSMKKKDAGYSVILSFFSLTLLPFCIHINFVTTFFEAITLGLSDYYVNIVSRGLISGIFSIAAYIIFLLTVFFSGLIAAHHSVDYRSGNFTKKDMKLQKIIKRVLSVFLAITVFSTLMAIPVFFASPDYKYEFIDGMAIIHIENKEDAAEIIERHVNDFRHIENTTAECYYAEYEYDIFDTSLVMTSYCNAKESEPWFPLVRDNEQEQRRADWLTSYRLYMSSVDIKAESGYLLIIPRIMNWTDEGGKSKYSEEDAVTVALPLEKPYNIAMNSGNEHFIIELF